jgi:hypothetical protein
VKQLPEHSDGRATAGVVPPTWSTWPGAARVILHPPHLRKTLTIALVVGTVLFCINQLDVVLRGDATGAVWLKSAITYLVPFCVSNAGVLVASRVERPDTD